MTAARDRATLIRHFPSTAPDEPVVVGFGDSITRGQGSNNWLDEVQRRHPGHCVVNAGKPGDLAWNLLQRIDAVVNTNPATVILLVGTNDVLAAESPQAGRTYRRRQKLPQAPTLAWYRENYTALVDRLRSDTAARILAVEIPPLGERPGSPQNAAVARYNAEVRRITGERGIEVLPLNAALAEMIAERTTPAPTFVHSDRKALAAFAQHYVLRRSWDEVARRNGLTTLIDHIHLTESAAARFVELVDQAAFSNERR